MKKKTSMTVLDSRQLAEGIYSLILAYPAGEAPRQVLPGQFAGIFPCDSSALLMRPISVNGYEISRMRGKRVLLLGGGIGIPPMLELAAALKEEARSVTAVLGYRNRELFLADEFRREAEVLIATEDGSVGTEGNVLDAVRAAGIQADVICACGPLPMLRAVSRYASEKGIPAFLSRHSKPQRTVRPPTFRSSTTPNLPTDLYVLSTPKVCTRRTR